MDSKKMFYVGVPDTDVDHIGDDNRLMPNANSENNPNLGNHGNGAAAFVDDTVTPITMDDTLTNRDSNDTDSSDSTTQNSEDENTTRGNWSGKLDFLLSCLSFAVGLGNVWRFPYQCYKNGGGAFLIPFVAMLFIGGIPLFFLETAFGQYASLGVISIWKVSPIFMGIGWAMFFVSFFVAIYYNVIIAWTFFYLFSSFTSNLPWGHCENDWNTPACSIVTKMDKKNCTDHNGVFYNHTCFTNYTVGEEKLQEIQLLVNESSVNSSIKSVKSPSDEYFHNYVLDISEGFHDLGVVRWQLALCLLLSWVLICGCMIKGIKSVGKVVYFTATFPYLVLTVLLVRGATLPGSTEGVIYYFTPQWEKLKEPKVWCDATVQLFFSLAPGWGGLISLSSYNKFHNNFLRDAFIVCIADVVTSIFAGIVIFSIIGYMAHEIGSDISEVVDEGAGLAFIVYPQVVTRLPVSPLWAILFFLMLITLGLGTQFAIVNTVFTTILDLYPEKLRVGKRPSFVMIGLCILFYILGLSCCTEGGMYMLQLMDSYAASYSVLFICFIELIALSWVYGFENLQADIKLMTGMKIGIIWKIAWKFITPIVLLCLIVFTWVDFRSTSYGTYEFPVYAEVLGFLFSFTSILSIPAVALYQILTKEKKLPLLQRIKKLSKPAEDWGPALPENRTGTVHMTANESQIPLHQNVATPVAESHI